MHFFFLRNAIENSREMLCVKKLQGIFCYQWKLPHRKCNACKKKIWASIWQVGEKW